VLKGSRPEKDHPAQLRALHALFQRYPEYRAQGVKLVLIGGSRNAGDAARVDALRTLADKLDIAVGLLRPFPWRYANTSPFRTMCSS
jgi:hypothetical protein